MISNPFNHEFDEEDADALDDDDDIEDLNFADQDLRNYSFRGQNLAGANFSGCDLRGCDFHSATLVGADFTGARTGNTLEQEFAVFRAIAISFLGVAGSEIFLISLAGALVIPYGPIFLSISLSLLYWAIFKGPTAITIPVAKTSVFGVTTAIACVGAWQGIQIKSLVQILSFAVPALIFLGFTLFFGKKMMRRLRKVSGTSFKNADLSNAKFTNAIIQRTDFSGAVVFNTDWTGVEFTRSQFSDRTKI